MKNTTTQLRRDSCDMTLHIHILKYTFSLFVLCLEQPRMGLLIEL